MEGFWGVELSQQEKGHGGGGATMSSDRGWTGLGTENLWSGLSDGRERREGGDGDGRQATRGEDGGGGGYRCETQVRVHNTLQPLARVSINRSRKSRKPQQLRSLAQRQWTTGHDVDLSLR